MEGEGRGEWMVDNVLNEGMVGECGESARHASFATARRTDEKNGPA